MFKLKKPESLLWPVVIDVPRDDGTGETDPHQIQVRFQYLDVDEQQKLFDPKDKSGAKVRDFVKGWAHIQDDDGNDLPFSPENLDKVMQVPYVAVAVNRAFFECQSGKREKN